MECTSSVGVKLVRKMSPDLEVVTFNCVRDVDYLFDSSKLCILYIDLLCLKVTLLLFASTLPAYTAKLKFIDDPVSYL